ncbi:MAG: hypothetical protein M1457_04820 [bacterium]|nr:hypothetical protein [bacterium]
MKSAAIPSLWSVRRAWVRRLAPCLLVAGIVAWWALARGAGLAASDESTTTPAATPALIAPAPAAPAGRAVAPLKLRSSPAAAGAADLDVTPGHPKIMIRGLKAEITRDGRPRQRIEAWYGELDETANILDLSGVGLRYYVDGKPKGEATCAAGRVWLAARPAEGVAQNDLLLQGGVRLSTEGTFLETPVMRFDNARETIHSEAGFVKQVPMEGGIYLIGRGQSFDIKLVPERGNFENWHERGNPVVIEKSEKPVIKP